MTDDPRQLIDATVQRHASVCGHCDVGVTSICICGDPRRAVLALADALRDVLGKHQPTKDRAGPFSLQRGTFCSCGEYEVLPHPDDGYPVQRIVEYPCSTVRAITNALGGQE